MEKIHLLITSGQGPRECAYVVAKVLEVLKSETGKAGISFKILGAEPSKGPGPLGLTSATVELCGATARTLVNDWLGTLQWIGDSPYRPGHKRKNWFIAVSEIPVPMEEVALTGKISVKAMRASGPGGQNVNKRSSAVRATHEETGISVVVRNSRSQAQNRKTADLRLREVHKARHDSRQAGAASLKWSKHQSLERGGARRVFRGEEFQEDHRPL